MYIVAFFAKYDTYMYLQIMFLNNKYLQKESITNCTVHVQFSHCKQKQFVFTYCACMQIKKLCYVSTFSGNLIC